MGKVKTVKVYWTEPTTQPNMHQDGDLTVSSCYFNEDLDKVAEAPNFKHFSYYKGIVDYDPEKEISEMKQEVFVIPLDVNKRPLISTVTWAAAPCPPHCPGDIAPKAKPMRPLPDGIPVERRNIPKCS